MIEIKKIIHAEAIGKNISLVIGRNGIFVNTMAGNGKYKINLLINLCVFDGICFVNCVEMPIRNKNIRTNG